MTTATAAPVEAGDRPGAVRLTQYAHGGGCACKIPPDELEQLVAGLPEDVALPHLEKWLQLAPFDRRAHAALLGALAGSGRLQEGEEHLAAAARLFEDEGLDPAPLRALWQAARGHRSSASQDGMAGPTTTAAMRSPPVNVTNGAPADHGLHRPTPTSGDRAAGPVARRASVAVMPFVGRCAASRGPGGPADGLAHDVITRLAKLRSLFVIAQGTTFALRDRGVGPEEAGRMLHVDYVVSGATRRSGKRLTVNADLIETRTARVIWADVFDDTISDALDVLDEIGNRIVASIAHEIETIERNRAILRPPNSLDAWEAYHRGLWHMYRFSRAENERAQHFFRAAVRLDPTFARAHAGLSFTHFQNAFQGWADRAPEIELAFATAGQSLMVDDRDPAAHWAMGRALWLRGQHEPSVVELEKTIDLSPNFALGHYALAFVHCQSGDARAAIDFVDHSRNLSPFDPMQFAMLGSRALAHIRLGQFAEAADWAVKAAARPNAHAHIMGIAAVCLALAGRLEEARGFTARIHLTRPRYGIDDFLSAFHFAPDAVALFRGCAKQIGLG